MRGHKNFCPLGDGDPPSRGVDNDGDQGQPRKASRGFFIPPQIRISIENLKFIWSIPPVYPFDSENRGENSGFLF
jgi:hypothetical protein